MGRYSGPLAARFADWSGVAGPGRALDVGCGTGALTRVLIERLGVDGVSAVDPSSQLLAALRQSFPTLDVQTGTAERLPYPDDLFDHALAQLVVSFMTDPVLGLREMARVTRPGGTVSACVWDLAGGGAPLTPFWRAARDLDPGVDDESGMPGAREGELAAPLRPGRSQPDRGHRPHGHRAAPDLRGLVGALHVRRRPGRGRTCGASTRSAGSGCATTAASCCPSRPSTSWPPPGPCAPAPDAYRARRDSADPARPGIPRGEHRAAATDAPTPDAPAAGPRLWPMFYSLGRNLLYPLSHALYRPTIEGKENIPREGGVIVASNHLSFIDSFAIPLASPRQVRFLAKEEYWTGTGVGGFAAQGLLHAPSGWCRSTGTRRPPRRRASTRRSRCCGPATRSASTRRARDRGTAGSTAGAPGVAWLALTAQVPIVPVGLIGTEDIQPVGARLPEAREGHGALRRADRRRGVRRDAGGQGASPADRPRHGGHRRAERPGARRHVQRGAGRRVRRS